VTQAAISREMDGAVVFVATRVVVLILVISRESFSLEYQIGWRLAKRLH
jgi:hypothetical protein